MRTDRTRAVRSAGGAILLLGIWGGVVPYVGPSFGYSMGGGTSWTWTESRASLHLVPAIVAVIGALMLLASRQSRRQRVGATLATLAGVWFVIAPSLHPLWDGRSGTGMMTMGTSKLESALQSLGYHYGTGVLIAVLGGFALGRLIATRQTLDDPVEHRDSATETVQRPSSLVDAY